MEGFFNGDPSMGAQHVPPVGLEQLLGLQQSSAPAPLSSPPPAPSSSSPLKDKEEEQPDYYQNLSLSLMNLPVHDSASQLIRPPDFFGLAAADENPATPTIGVFANGKKAASAASQNPWSGLFDSGPADPAAPKKSEWILELPSFAVQPVPDLTVNAPAAVPQQPQKQQQQQKPQPVAQQVEEQAERAAGKAKAPSASQARKRNGRPELQRAKRKALTDLFLLLKQASYGDAMGRDPVVTAAIGRGKRSVNSKEAILRKASRDIVELEQRAAALEAEVASLEAGSPAASTASSACSAPASVRSTPADDRAQFMAGRYATGAAARFLTTPHGRLVSYSGAVSAALGTPEEALVMAMRGELSSYALIPAALRSEYYALLPVVLDASGPSHVEVRAHGTAGHIKVIRCGSGPGMTLDHVWVPSA